MADTERCSALQILQGWVAAWNRGDWDEVLSTLDPDVVSRPDPRFPAPVAHGITAMEAFLEDMREGWGEHRIELLEEQDLGDRCLARARSTIIGPASGITIPTEWSIVLTMRSGKIIMAEFFIEHESAREALRMGDPRST